MKIKGSEKSTIVITGVISLLSSRRKRGAKEKNSVLFHHLIQAGIAMVTSTYEAFWAAVAAQQAAEGASATPWKQTTSTALASDTGGQSGAAGGNVATVAANSVCALCHDRSPGRWITRCRGPGGGPRQPTCSVWVHPACAWQVGTQMFVAQFTCVSSSRSMGTLLQDAKCFHHFSRSRTCYVLFHPALVFTKESTYTSTSTSNDRQPLNTPRYTYPGYMRHPLSLLAICPRRFIIGPQLAY